MNLYNYLTNITPYKSSNLGDVLIYFITECITGVRL